MDAMQAYSELLKGSRIKRSSIANGYFLEFRKGKIHVASKRGQFVDYKPTQADLLATDWEIVSDEKITKVDYTKRVIFEAECPGCLSLNGIAKDDIESKDDKIITCSKCGYDFGLKKDSDKENVKSDTDSI
jgi:Zn ribbon nucleic-acid-binding protein